MSGKKVSILLFESYLSFIKNSVGAKTFRNLYAIVGNKKIDILSKGKKSCAVFTSSILMYFHLIKEPHSTVQGLMKDLERSGWMIINKPRKGAILIWEEMMFNESAHLHAGFYIGDNRAVSTDSRKKIVINHHWTYGVKKGKPVRKVIKIFYNKKLEK